MDGQSVEDLLCVDLSTIRKSLKGGGYSFSRLDQILPVGGRCISALKWTRTTVYGERRTVGEVRYCIGRDSDGLYLGLEYSTTREGRKCPHEIRYRLVRKESNLKPGYYRYYILDSYSEDYRLCTKLYLMHDIFYPRSIIASSGILYRQQREGHTKRYVWTFYHRVPKLEEMRYRKSHYRGRITPVWKRYKYLCEEGDSRVLSYLVSTNNLMYSSLIGENRL